MSLPQKKTILMVALDFPPCQSAGVQRTLKFAEYLADLGWQPIVLTVNESVYGSVDSNIKIPESIKVYRCKSLDSARDLSIKGKYFSWSKVPDRWWSWAISAVPLGKKLIAKYKPDIIWSTYPVSTAHYIAYKLHQHSQINWVADYRDPLQCRYDSNAQQYSFVAKWIEKKTITHCSKAVFTTERSAQLYRRLYPDEKLSKFCVIENGFDEANFNDLPTVATVDSSRFTLLHSGAIYPQGRDPQALFSALSVLKNEGVIDSSNFVLAFRGAVNSPAVKSQVNELGIEDIVEFRANIAYKESLAEMMSANALVLIQGKLFNNQIPGKAYEYIRCNKPILALTPEEGATGTLLSTVAATEVAETSENIKRAISRMLEQQTDGERQSASYSRYAKTQQLDLLLRALD
ncbi:glycosyltransferase [Colwellia sp. D2M02]|uniref:glycosyltransferase n=1 Tax=Colwellia sp. D2M02 TaxID=2841562 RepID=UPI001C08AB4B|nr:glycosyltransferase [Colwellia sp. D2M02]MBU2894682.1 glycosyltransferase [Colwellia sp. D2M02]